MISPGVYVHGSERKDTWSVIGCYRQSTVTGRAKNLTGVFSGYSLTGLNSIKFKWLKNHRYSGWLTGGGISYGYHLILNRHWNLEVSLGIGYEYIRYDKYACPDLCAAWKERESYHYFGPDKFSLSIVYVFN